MLRAKTTSELYIYVFRVNTTSAADYVFELQGYPAGSQGGEAFFNGKIGKKREQMKQI